MIAILICARFTCVIWPSQFARRRIPAAVPVLDANIDVRRILVEIGRIELRFGSNA